MVSSELRTVGNRLDSVAELAKKSYGKDRIDKQNRYEFANEKKIDCLFLVQFIRTITKQHNTATMSSSTIANVVEVQVQVQDKETKVRAKSVPDKFYKLMAFANWLLPQISGKDENDVHALLKFYDSNSEIIAFYSAMEEKMPDHVATFKALQKAKKATVAANNPSTKKARKPTKKADEEVHADADATPSPVVEDKKKTTKKKVKEVVVEVVAVTDAPVDGASTSAEQVAPASPPIVTEEKKKTTRKKKTNELIPAATVEPVEIVQQIVDAARTPVATVKKTQRKKKRQ